MGSEVQATLQSIQTSLNILIVLIGLNLIFGAARFWQMTRRLISETRDDVFRVAAMEFADKGDFAKLAEQCREDLRVYPNHALALWFLAKAQIGLKEYDQARQTLDRLLISEPGWAESHTKPMLSIVESLTKTSSSGA